MLCVDAAALTALWRLRHPATLLPLLGALMLGVCLPALAMGADMFHGAALLACGVFIHGGIIGVGATAMLWRRFRRLSVAAAVLSLLLGVVALDAFVIEPQWLEVSRVHLASAKLRKPLKIVLVADLQTDQIGAYERRVLGQVMHERPDLILFAGDYVQVYDAKRYEALCGQLNDLLTELSFAAPLSVVAVAGNTDPAAEDRPRWERIFEGLPVRCLNRTQTIDLGPLKLTGLSMADSFDPALRVEAVEGFHIVLGHAPDFALGEIDADLMLAGHTHGGQVRLPLFGPPLTLSRVPRAWAAGVTRLDDQRTLIVSRGIGMERARAPRMRFLCRPQLVVVELVPDGGNESRVTGNE